MMVGRVLVTPTRIVRLLPEAELSNRILRHFKQASDRFIRISFGEEDGSVLHIGPKSNLNADLVKRCEHAVRPAPAQLLSSSACSQRQSIARLPRRMEQILDEGVHVAGRHFEFLAFSTSQLKEHSVWAFSPTPELATADVHAWMGEFEGIRCVAKYAARMGQCFSSSLDTVEIKVALPVLQPGLLAVCVCAMILTPGHACGAQDSEGVSIPDIVRNGFVFSDGCGLISTELAHSVALELKQLKKLNSQAHTNPCAYQLRFGGCKGVVVAYPHHPRYDLGGRKWAAKPPPDKLYSACQCCLQV